MLATIYHNPHCGTSRNVLALLRHFGCDVEIIDYVQNPPTGEGLFELIQSAGLTVRQAIRDKQPEFLSLKLDQPGLSDAELIDAMIKNPILINRPFVVTEYGARLARPSERVLEILPRKSVGPFFKEDGSEILWPDGQSL